MNFIGYYELKPEDFDEVIKKFQEAMAEREKDPDKYPKILFGPVTMGGQWRGFTVYEDPTGEQLNALMIQYKDLMTFKFVHIYDSAKFIEQYLKTKK